MIGRVAADHAVSPYQVTARLAPGKSPRLIPIAGAGRPASIEDSAAAGALALTAGERELLETA